MVTLTVHPKNKKQLTAVEAVLKALDVDFKKGDDSPYAPEFAAKIRASQKQAEEGKIVSYTITELENLCK